MNEWIKVTLLQKFKLRMSVVSGFCSEQMRPDVWAAAIVFVALGLGSF